METFQNLLSKLYFLASLEEGKKYNFLYHTQDGDGYLETISRWLHSSQCNRSRNFEESKEIVDLAFRTLEMYSHKCGEIDVGVSYVEASKQLLHAIEGSLVGIKRQRDNYKVDGATAGDIASWNAYIEIADIKIRSFKTKQQVVETPTQKHIQAEHTTKK